MVTPVSANGALNPEPTPAAEMAAILGNILKKHGKAVLEDRRRTLGLLHDYAPGEARCVRLLMSAYDADVPKNLMAEDGAPNELKLEQEASSLVADSGLQVELARWAVSVWSSALTGMLPAGVAAAQAEISAGCTNGTIGKRPDLGRHGSSLPLNGGCDTRGTFSCAILCARSFGRPYRRNEHVKPAAEADCPLRPRRRRPDCRDCESYLPHG